MIKISANSREELCQLHREYLQKRKPTANDALNGKKLKAFPLRLGR